MKSRISLKQHLLSLGLVLLLSACGDDNKITLTEPLAQQSIESYIESQRFTGSVLIVKDGETILQQGFGLADKSNNITNTAETTFLIGSVTKQFTAMAVLILEERGLLTLDDPLSLYLADFPRGDEIKLVNLLNMTSGIVNYTNLSGFSGYKYDSLSASELIAKFSDQPLRFNPGEKYEYSNSNYVLAGYIIEQVSGQSYADFVQQAIFDKLSMQHSGYGYKNLDGKQFAVGYGDGKAVKKLDMSIPYAAGALVSTVNDLYKWHIAIRDRVLISQATTEKMHQVGLAGYALGWNIRVDNNDNKYYQHGGGIDGFSSYILRTEPIDYFIAVLSNDEDFPSGQLVSKIMPMIDAN